MLENSCETQPAILMGTNLSFNAFRRGKSGFRANCDCSTKRLVAGIESISEARLALSISVEHLISLVYITN